MIAETTAEAASASSRRFVRNIAVLGGSQVVTWALTLAWTVVVPRFVGPTGIGELTTATAVASIAATVLELGLAVLLVREIARDRRRAPSLIGTALVIEVALFPLGVLAIALFLSSQRFGLEQNMVIFLAAASMLPAILKVPMQATFQAFERMNFVGLTGILTKLGGSLGGIALVAIGFGVVPLAGHQLVVPLAALGLVVEVITLWLNFKWIRSVTHIDWRPRLAGAIALCRASLPFFANYLIHNTYTWIAAVLLAVMTSAQVVGWYGVSTRLLNTLFFLPAIVSTAFLPRLSAGYDGNLSRLQERARPTFELVLLISLPIAAGAALVARQTIAFVYGVQFAASAEVLAVLLISLPFTYLNIAVWQMLVACDRQVLWTKVTGVAMVANILLSVVLIAYFNRRFQNGALGAAIALSTTEILMAGVGLAILPKLFNRRSFGRFLRAAVATAGMAAVVLATRRFELEVEIPAGIVTFVGLSLILKVLSISELKMVWSSLRHRRRLVAI